MTENSLSSVTIRPKVDSETETRLNWLLDLIHESEKSLLEQVWCPDQFDRLRSGVDNSGRRLPVSGSACAERLGWLAETPEGVYAPCRFRRIVQAQVAASMRTALFQDMEVLAQTSEVRSTASTACQSVAANGR